VSKTKNEAGAAEPRTTSFEIYANPETDPEAAYRVHTAGLASGAYANALVPRFGKMFGDVNLTKSAITHVDELIRRMAPRDPMEEMLIIEALMTHARVLHLTRLANMQTDLKQIRVVNEYADRASNTYRRQMLALAEYRKPPKAGDSFTSIRQANISQRQVVVNGGSDGKENATNEQGGPSDDWSPSERRHAPKALPAEPRGPRLAQSLSGPHEAVGAVHRPEDG